MNLIQEIILQHGRNSPYKRKIINPSLTIEAENRLCGDTLTIDIIIEKGKIIDMAFSGEGCLISQSAASLLIEKVKKIKDIGKIKKFNKNTIFNLLKTPLTLSRIRCALLCLEALQKALINY